MNPVIDNSLIEKPLKLPEVKVIDFIQNDDSAKFIVEISGQPQRMPQLRQSQSLPVGATA